MPGGSPQTTPPVSAPDNPLSEPYVEAREDIQEAVSDVAESISEEVKTTLRELDIADDDTPLGAFDKDETESCLFHGGMVFGIIATLVYTTAVVVRRRKDARDLGDFENRIIEGERRNSSSSTKPVVIPDNTISQS